MTTPEEEERLAAKGWIKHDGKGMPVDGRTLVRVMFMGGGISAATEAFWWVWDTPTITHYRVVTPAQAEPAPVPADTLTIRDQFAMAALPGLLVRTGGMSRDWEGLMSEAYEVADAALAVRARK